MLLSRSPANSIILSLRRDGSICYYSRILIGSRVGSIPKFLRFGGVSPSIIVRLPIRPKAAPMYIRTFHVLSAFGCTFARLTESLFVPIPLLF